MLSSFSFYKEAYQMKTLIVTSEKAKTLTYLIERFKRFGWQIVVR